MDLKIAELVAKDVDPDQMPQNMASDLSLHYLPGPLCQNA